MRFWHHFLSAYFGFNQQQRNGLLVLICLIIVVFGIRLSLSHLIEPAPMLVADFSDVKIPAQLAEQKEYQHETNSDPKNNLFVFDPNQVTKEQLIKLGLKEKTASTFINYRNKGGHFNKKEDLKKVYGIGDYLYKKLEPFILVEVKRSDLPKAKESGKTTPPVTKKSKLELNRADSSGLLDLKGIGPVFARRILKYRSMLGGFTSADQLSEVYGMTPELFQSVKNDVTADASLIKKINVNTENFKELNKHPYISYDITKVIFNHRRKNGPLKTMEELKTLLADESIFNKLAPYVAFE